MKICNVLCKTEIEWEFVTTYSLALKLYLLYFKNTCVAHVHFASYANGSNHLASIMAVELFLNVCLHWGINIFFLQMLDLLFSPSGRVVAQHWDGKDATTEMHLFCIWSRHCSMYRSSDTDENMVSCCSFVRGVRQHSED